MNNSPSRQPLLHRLFQPKPGSSVPVLIDVPHAGELEPPKITEELLASFNLRRRDFDLFVDRFWKDAPSYGAQMLVARYSRYVVDLNRENNDVDAGSVEGCPNPEGLFRRGLLWQVTSSGERVMPRALTQPEFARRVAEFHTPYHAKLQGLIDALRSEFGRVVLLDAHSMPGKGRSDHPDSGQVRADIVPGDNEGKACDPALTALCVKVFGDHGYRVAVNDPYRGGWITRHYGQPQKQQHALQIEVNRSLYMDEETFALKEDGIAKLQRACAEMVQATAAWILKQGGA